MQSYYLKVYGMSFCWFCDIWQLPKLHLLNYCSNIILSHRLLNVLIILFSPENSFWYPLWSYIPQTYFYNRIFFFLHKLLQTILLGVEVLQSCSHPGLEISFPVLLAFKAFITKPTVILIDLPLYMTWCFAQISMHFLCSMLLLYELNIAQRISLLVLPIYV